MKTMLSAILSCFLALFLSLLVLLIVFSVALVGLLRSSQNMVSIWDSISLVRVIV